ncbi:MAG: hypothetical protein ACLPKI_10945 [Streptosporangiaceae bacterium]
MRLRCPSASSMVCGPPRASVQEIAQKRRSPSDMVWRPWVRLPSMPMRMSLNSLIASASSPAAWSVASISVGASGSQSTWHVPSSPL